MSDGILLESGSGVVLMENTGEILLEIQQPAVVAGGGGQGGDRHSHGSRHWYDKRRSVSVQKVWQEVARIKDEEKNELGQAWDKAHGIVEATIEVLDAPMPPSIPREILKVAKAIPERKSAERTAQTERLIELIIQLVNDIEEQQDEDDLAVLLMAA